MKNLITALCVSFIFLSCSKSESSLNGEPVTPPLVLLQNKWLVDSVFLYPATGMSSAPLSTYKSTDSQYLDFKSNNKAYSYGGIPTVAYDTSSYKLLADNTTFLVHVLKSGVEAARTDTCYILKLTANSLEFYIRNDARQYGKSVLKR